jgi:hypothetical protein
MNKYGKLNDECAVFFSAQRPNSAFCGNVCGNVEVILRYSRGLLQVPTLLIPSQLLACGNCGNRNHGIICAARFHLAFDPQQESGAKVTTNI